MPQFLVLPRCTSSPSEGTSFEDTDDHWNDLLDPRNVQVLAEGETNLATVDRRKAEGSPAITAAEYRPDADSLARAQIVGCHGLVLDVDAWRDDRPAFTRDELAQRLAGFRAICWTTFKSTSDVPRYRVVIPVTPVLPASKYRAVATAIVRQVLDGTVSETTLNPNRLGFFASAQSETVKAAYWYEIFAGQVLDWRVLNPADDGEDSRAAQPSERPQPATDWISDEDVAVACRRYYRDVGKETQVGGRHERLFITACQLWHEWAAPEPLVREILTLVNSNFAEPKPPEEIEREIKAGWDRTMGEAAQLQETPYGFRREPRTKATKAGMQELAAKLRRRDGVTARALQAVLRGAPVGEPAEARTLLNRVFDALASEYPKSAPDTLLDLVRPGIDAQRARQPATAPLQTDAEMLARIRRQQAQTLERRAHAEAERVEEQRARIRSAFEIIGQNRDTPYTREELSQFYDDGHADNRWILQYGDRFFFFVGGRYVDFRERAANNMVGKLLAPAEERIPLTFIDKLGSLKHKSCSDLIREGWGRAIPNLEYSLIDGDSGFRNDRGGTLRIAHTSIEHKPGHHPVVEDWLKTLAGDKVDLLVRWLSMAPRLDNPLVMLGLIAQSGAGKGLLASGLSALWSTGGPVESEFYPNDLARCPVVLVDEAFPKPWIQAGLSSMVRRVTGCREVTAKPHLYEDPHKILGCARFILSANGIEVLQMDRMGSNARQALAKRLLLIENKTDAPVKFLANLSKPARDELARFRIAEHVLWLRDNIAENDERFGVIDDVAGIEKTIATTNAAATRVYDWLVSYLEQGRFSGIAVLVDNQGILVNPASLRENWNLFDRRTDLSPGQISRALGDVSTGRQGVLFTSSSTPTAALPSGVTWYRQLDWARFERYLRDTNGPLEAVQDSLSTLLNRVVFKRTTFVPST